MLQLIMVKVKRPNVKLDRKKIISAVIILLLFSVILFIWLRPEVKPEEYPTVEVIPVGRADVEVYGEYVGRVRAQQFVEVRARVDLPVDEGRKARELCRRVDGKRRLRCVIP